MEVMCLKFSHANQLLRNEYLGMSERLPSLAAFRFCNAVQTLLLLPWPLDLEMPGNSFILYIMEMQSFTIYNESTLALQTSDPFIVREVSTGKLAFVSMVCLFSHLNITNRKH